MGSLLVLASFLLLVSVIAHLWLSVRAFKESGGWGLAVLFLSPIAAIVYAVKFWEDVKKPFLTYVGSTVAAVIAVTMLFVQIGGFAMMEMAQQLQSGEMTEAEAQQFVLDAMGRTEESGMLSDEDRQELAEMRRMAAGQDVGDTDGEIDLGASRPSLSAAASGLSTRAGADAPTMLLSSPTRPRAEEPEEPLPPRRTRGPIPLAEADDYVGSFVVVRAHDGLEHRGTLAGTDGGTLVLERYLFSGTMAFEMPLRDVKSIELAGR